MIISLRIRLTRQIRLTGWSWLAALIRLAGSIRLAGWIGVAGRIVLVLDQQLQSLGGSGQNPDSPGPPGSDRIGVASDGQDLGDAVHRRQKPDGITCRSFGDNGFQPVFGVKA